MKKNIRVLIADDHEIMRMGLAALLETDDEIEVVAEATDGIEAVEKTVRLRPDVVIMDLMMPRKDGSEATQEIKAAVPETKVLLLTTFGTALSRNTSEVAFGALTSSLSTRLYGFCMTLYSTDFTSGFGLPSSFAGSHAQPTVSSALALGLKPPVSVSTVRMRLIPPVFLLSLDK